MRTPARVRIDRLIVDKGLAESREKAARHLLAGEVFADGVKIDKAGALVSTTAKIEVRGSSRYVSRGGDKLIHAIEHCKVSVAGRVCLDVGASTGGFTDCLLQLGASRVYAVDVGTGQLDARLRNDPRVVVMEHTSKDGTPKLLKSCTLPLTGAGVVDLVVTDLAAFDLKRGDPKGLRLIELAPGVTLEEIKTKTEAQFAVALS